MTRRAGGLLISAVKWAGARAWRRQVPRASDRQRRTLHVTAQPRVAGPWEAKLDLRESLSRRSTKTDNLLRTALCVKSEQRHEITSPIRVAAGRPAKNPGLLGPPNPLILRADSLVFLAAKITCF